MRTLAINAFLTLDGVMQAPGGPEEDPTGGFTHGGWSVNYWDDRMGERAGEWMTDRPFDLLLGRKTYEIFAAHWPHAGDAMADRLNSATKYVASRTLDEAGWSNSILIRDDVPGRVAQLKEEEGPEIQVHGSSDLIRTLLEHDLVDELRLWIFPLVLGTGKRLFATGAIPAGLKLAHAETSTTGVLITRYERAGEIAYGSFALAND